MSKKELFKNLGFCCFIAVALTLVMAVPAFADSGPLAEVQNGLKLAGIFLGGALCAYGAIKFGFAYSQGNGGQNSDALKYIVGGAVIIFGAGVLGSIPLPF